MKYKLKKDTILLVGGAPIMCHKGFEVDVIRMRRGYTPSTSYYVDNYDECDNVEIRFNGAYTQMYDRGILDSFEIVEDV